MYPTRQRPVRAPTSYYSMCLFDVAFIVCFLACCSFWSNKDVYIIIKLVTDDNVCLSVCVCVCVPLLTHVITLHTSQMARRRCNRTRLWRHYHNFIGHWPRSVTPSIPPLTFPPQLLSQLLPSPETISHLNIRCDDLASEQLASIAEMNDDLRHH